MNTNIQDPNVEDTNVEDTNVRDRLREVITEQIQMNRINLEEEYINIITNMIIENEILNDGEINLHIDGNIFNLNIDVTNDNQDTIILRRVLNRSIRETKKRKTVKHIKELIQNNIPRHKVLNKNNEIIKNKEECVICANEYKTRQWIIELECGHIFHKKCIDKWFIKSREMKCPFCRKDFEKIV